jgi:hypothetical protein
VPVSGVLLTLTLPWLLVALHVGVLVDRVTAAETLCNEFAGPSLGGLLVAAGAAVALGSTAGADSGVTVTQLVTCWAGWFALMPLVAANELGLRPDRYGALVAGLGGTLWVVNRGASASFWSAPR